MSGFDPNAYLKSDAPSTGFDPEAYLSDGGKPEDRGVKVYAEPAGPEQAGAFDRFAERVQDSQRWKAILSNQGPYAKDVVAGTAPLVAPAGALGAFGRAAVALGQGEGVGYAAGRTALAAGQGAAMSALDGQEGESAQDKIDRAKSGAKLSGGIQVAAESLPYVGKALGYGARKLGSMMSGEDESLIANYAKYTDKVNQIIKDSGGDVTTAADNVRTELSKGIQQAKGALNGQITATLERSAPEATIPAQSIIDRLEAAKARLNPNFKASAIADIDEMISNIQSQAKDGMLNPRGLYETKQYLNENSSGAYLKGGQMFSRAGEAAKAAKDAAGEAREAIKTHLPEISEADQQLSKMRTIEGRLNKNLLAPGTPEGALLAAGSGANPRNAANLRKLEEISGVDVAQRAKDLATARAFSNPSLLPKDFTGKAAARLLVGAGVGGAVDGKEGALVGGMLASPMAVKGIINAANVAGKMGAAAGIPQVAQAIRQNPFAAQAVAQLAAGQIRRANTNNPMNRGPAPGAQPTPEAAPELMQQGGPTDRTPASAPARGEAAWTSRGLQRLGIQDEATAARLMADPKARALLIQASDLPAGSPALKRIQTQIQSLRSK